MGKLTIQQGSIESLAIEANEAVPLHISSDVVNGKLVLALKVEWWEWLTWVFAWILLPTKDLRYTVGVCELSGASVSGNGKITADWLKGDDMDSRISGSGTIDLDGIEFRQVSTRVSGSGRVQMTGTAAIRGSGNASVNASSKLYVWISGSGAVFYMGQPRVSQHITGAGRVGAA